MRLNFPSIDVLVTKVTKRTRKGDGREFAIMTLLCDDGKTYEFVYIGEDLQTVLALPSLSVCRISFTYSKNKEEEGRLYVLGVELK